MPYTWSIDVARGLATVTATGPIDFDNSVQVLRDLVASQDFDLSFGVLVDLREAGASPTLEELSAFSEVMSRLGFFKGRTAIVVSSSFNFSHARQLASFAEERGLQVEAFTSIRGALRWLGIPE